jgi:DNA-directed RNA polymerase specialized sigma24 family protein
MERASLAMQKNSPDSPTKRRDLRTPGDAFDSRPEFIEAVRPFHRVLYLVALAYTKDRETAELLAIESMAVAFKEREGIPQSPDEFKAHLIQTAISEGGRYLKRDAQSDLKYGREEVGDCFVNETIPLWRSIPNSTVGDDAVRCTAMSAIEELSPLTAVTLFLRDAWHLTPLEISALIGETQQKVQTRLAYGRITLCVKLAGRVASHGFEGEASLAAAY